MTSPEMTLWACYILRLDHGGPRKVKLITILIIVINISNHFLAQIRLTVEQSRF